MTTTAAPQEPIQTAADPVSAFMARWSEITAERLGRREVLGSIVGDILMFECVQGRILVATSQQQRRPPAPSEEKALLSAILQGHLQIIERDFASDSTSSTYAPLLRASGSYQLP